MSKLRGGDCVTAVIKCDLAFQVQCDMKFLLQLYPCALAFLAARSAVCVENRESQHCIITPVMQSTVLLIDLEKLMHGMPANTQPVYVRLGF